MTKDAILATIAEGGYPALRQTFNAVLQEIADGLSDEDMSQAYDVLDLDEEEGVDEQGAVLLMDAALFSRPDEPDAPRAIDRLAPKAGRDNALTKAIAARLPTADFSVYEAGATHPDGGLKAFDMLAGTEVHIMDEGLAASFEPGGFFAGRFAGLGPWHIGFGVVSKLTRSEVVALILAASGPDGRDELHEMVYRADLHGEILIMSAVEPAIALIATMIDESSTPIGEIAGRLARAMEAATTTL